MTWKVFISGDKYILERLSQSLKDDPAIDQQEGQFYMWCSDFEDCSTHPEVKEVADELLTTLYGGIKLQMGPRETFPKPSINHIVKEKEDGSKDISKGMTADVILRGKASGDKNGSVFSSSSEGVMGVVESARENEQVKDLMKLFNREDTWGNLYRILEFVEDNLDEDDEESVVDKGWISGNKRELFKRTANNRISTGDDARHGYEKHQPPRNPMPINEARTLIYNIIKKWLQYKIR